jgi:hypothetical protein
MNQKEMLNKLKSFFDLEERERGKQKKDIKVLLKKLRARERKLKDKLDEEKKSTKRKRIQQEIDVIYAQRKKGIKLIKEL